MATFETTLFQQGNNTGIEVPEPIVEALAAGKRAPVVVDVNGFEYRSTIAVMGGKYLIPFSSDKRAATGLGGGDAITVTLTVDAAPRTVEVPEDLAAALAGTGLREAFDSLAPSKQKAHVTNVEGAKAADTRARRVAKIVTDLGPALT
ncbi:YdeI/OmpD-associated family protein [Aeromicrobium sp. Leaf350]|uniref:YdeI/OmpD-associated family protein n=1 Tax=Aeromicrobium sp. Leaf350 TaxID=2876565 RepID=UPI001E50D55D|nr:YdeI/OmpD-associated family protein [Aeromicrobium sp. Leaf350]